MVGGSFDNEEEVESLNPSLVSNPSSKSSSTKSSSKKKKYEEEDCNNHNNSDRPHKSKKKKSKRRHSEKSRKRSSKDNKEGGENDIDLHYTTRSESQGSGSVATNNVNDESSSLSDRRKQGYGRKTSFSNSTKILTNDTKEEVTGQPPLGKRL